MKSIMIPKGLAVDVNNSSSGSKKKMEDGKWSDDKTQKMNC